MPDLARLPNLAFREELHAIEAAISGQGVAICSDALVATELASGATLLLLENRATPTISLRGSFRAGSYFEPRDKPGLAPVAQAAPQPLAVALEPDKTDADKELAQRVMRAIDDAQILGIDARAVEGVVTLWGATVSARERSRAEPSCAGALGATSPSREVERLDPPDRSRTSKLRPSPS